MTVLVYLCGIVLRMKLSGRLSACVQDRPCPQECGHLHKEVCMFKSSQINGGRETFI